jgi:hypothetical protein
VQVGSAKARILGLKKITYDNSGDWDRVLFNNCQSQSSNPEGVPMTAINTRSDKFMIWVFLGIVAVVSFILFKLIVGSDGI